MNFTLNNQQNTENVNEVYQVTSHEQLREFIENSKQHNIPLFMKFSATWCRPCKRIQPFYEKLASQYQSSVFVTIDVDLLDGISEVYGVKSLPTFSVIKEGVYYELMKGSNSQKLHEVVAASLS